ncbi:MAG: GPR endopeptidase [Clostridia bacterium]|nr:GPR endopeptidase [Clostridia bacterium]
MNLRTDLAIEQREIAGENNTNGVEHTEFLYGKAKITEIKITDENGEKALKRKKGKYITVELPGFGASTELFGSSMKAVSEQLSRLLPKDGLVLVAGLGNEQITPDALGPKCASLIFSTRHISKELQKSIGFEQLRPVARITPGVLGQNGIETGEILAGIIKQVSPSALITVDALASRRLSRLGRTVQLCDTGITPGSGVGNARTEISQETMGVPVIALGVPTVVDAATLAYDLTGESGQNKLEKASKRMMVTPREIDLIIERASKLIAMAINHALQPHMDAKDIYSLVS